MKNELFGKMVKEEATIGIGGELTRGAFAPVKPVDQAKKPEKEKGFLAKAAGLVGDHLREGTLDMVHGALTGARKGAAEVAEVWGQERGRRAAVGFFSRVEDARARRAARRQGGGSGENERETVKMLAPPGSRTR